MRYREFLFEYDRSREQQRIESLPAYQQRLKQEPRFSLERLESVDPTPQKSYVPRLAQWWLAGEPFEDLISTTADALDKYHKLKTKKQIKPEHADINRFKTADAFDQAVSQYQLPQDQPKEDRGKYREIFRDQELLVIELLDETAAKFWGQGTKWCTAAKNNNMFNYYAGIGPLYVIIPRDDPQNKYQYWFENIDPYTYQFMNVQDDPVKPDTLPFYSKLQPIMRKLSSHIMWNTNPTEVEQIIAVEQQPMSSLFRIVEKLNITPSEQVIMTAVSMNAACLQYLIAEQSQRPQQIKISESLLLKCVEKTPSCIQYIPNPTEKMQLIAVSNTGWLISVLYDNDIEPSEAVQLAAIKQDPQYVYSNIISNGGEPSEAVVVAGIQKDPYVIRDVKNPSEQVQIMAVSEVGALLRDLLRKKKIVVSEKVVLAALNNDPEAIRFFYDPKINVHKIVPTREMILRSVNEAGYLIMFIPNPDTELQMAAVKNDFHSYLWIEDPDPAVTELYNKLKSQSK